jgi:hypothetical protein
MVKTYIHTNDHEPVTSKLLSPPSVTFSKFKNNSLNQENNYSANGFMSNNSPFNSLAKLISLKSPLTLFSLVSPHHESE